MEYQEYESNYTESTELKQLQATFMTKVYGWMFLALIITGLVALFTAASDAVRTIVLPNYYVLILLQLGLVIGISWGINKISSVVATLLFLIYSAFVGLTLSIIFLVFRIEIISATFFITAATFGIMSAIGYFTKKDLSSIGQLLMMGLIGIIIASVANWFLKSPGLYYIISYVGLFIFIGLVAYDTQKIKRMATLQLEGKETTQKGAIMGALSLYLDFINIFLFLLRIFGGRR